MHARVQPLVPPPEGLPRRPPLETLLAALVYLMSRYAARPDPDLAGAVSFHLELLARREDCGSEVLAAAARRLWPQWQGLALDCPAAMAVLAAAAGSATP